VEQGERNREAAPELVIMLIRMICGEPQTDEEQQDKRWGRRRRRKRRIRAGGEERKAEERVKPLAMLTGCSIRTPIFLLSLSRFSPLSLISTFLPSFSPHLFPLSLTLRVSSVYLPACISSPRDEREKRKERKREREKGPGFRTVAKPV